MPDERWSPPGQSSSWSYGCGLPGADTDGGAEWLLSTNETGVLCPSRRHQLDVAPRPCRDCGGKGPKLVENGAERTSGALCWGTPSAPWSLHSSVTWCASA